MQWNNTVLTDIYEKIDNDQGRACEGRVTRESDATCDATKYISNHVLCKNASSRYKYARADIVSEILC